MPASNEVHLLPLSSILVDRPARQRREIDVESDDFKRLRSSIAARGLLNPIIIRRDLHLVAGERRLAACKALGHEEILAHFLDELSPHEATIAELEENVQRKDLSWQEMAHAVARYHSIMQESEPSWSFERTAAALNIGVGTTFRYIGVIAASKTDPSILNIPEPSRAFNRVKRQEERAITGELDRVMQGVGLRAMPDVLPQTHGMAHSKWNSQAPEAAASSPSPPQHILCASFLEWAPLYTGPKFNLLHCDFPYGIGMHDSDQAGTAEGGRDSYEDTEEIYQALIDTLLTNIDRLLLPSAHAIFWFSMKHYEWTRRRLSSHFHVHPFPLIWAKSDKRGIIPDARRYGRQCYETAFLLTRGDRPIVKPVENFHHSPTERSVKWHISVKPVPMLTHFLSMLCDDYSEMLDPTCGSGTALQAAARLGAARLLGLELNPDYVREARLDLQREQNKLKLSTPLTPLEALTPL